MTYALPDHHAATRGRVMLSAFDTGLLVEFLLQYVVVISQTKPA